MQSLLVHRATHVNVPEYCDGHGLARTLLIGAFEADHFLFVIALELSGIFCACASTRA